MDIRLFLSKVLILLYRTRQLEMDSYDAMIESSLELLKINDSEEQFLGISKTKKLLEFIVETLHNQHTPMNLETLLPHLELMLDNDPKLFKIIAKSMEKELEDKEIKETIGNLIAEISAFVREQKAIIAVSRMSYDLKFNRSSIKNFGDYLKMAIAELEPLATNTLGAVDPAIVREVDFNNQKEIEEVYEDVKRVNTEEGVYKTGWKCLNKMLQGGFHQGHTCGIGALQHKYKTGFSLSLFMQLATLNNPILTDKDIEGKKKPLIIRISLEDSLENNFQFMYQYLKANEGVFLKPKDISSLSTEEMATYVNKRMTETGFSVKMLRIDPSMWSYSDLFSYVLKQEAQGYSVKIVVLDYMTMLQTTGCTQGPAGTDKRDLLRRIRNFMSARGITFITPLQLSSEAKQLTRQGVSDVNFLKEINEKGFYSDSKLLDQELDLELYIHLAKANGRTFLCIQRGKHRLPTIIEDHDKFAILPFKDKDTPLLEDIYKDDMSMKSLPSGSGGMFNNGGSNLLDEVLS